MLSWNFLQTDYPALFSPFQTDWKIGFAGVLNGRPQKRLDFEKWTGFLNFWSGGSWTRPYGTPSDLS